MFLEAFYIEFEGPEPSKTSKNLRKNMVFQESGFRVAAQLFMPKSLQKQGQNPSRNHKKVHQKTISKNDCFFNRFCLQNEA